MRTLRTLVTAVVLLGTVTACIAAETVEMANLVPANAKVLIEMDNAAGLRQMLLK